MTRARDLANIADGTFTATDLDLSGTLTVSGDATFDTNTLFVDVSANAVGIGTTSPAASLHVVSGATTTALIQSSAVATTLAINNTHANAWGSNLAIRTGGVDSGYFGTIGSLLGSTSQDLTVYATAGNGFRVYTNGNNERMRITSAGNVGIGTSSPASSAYSDSSNKYLDLKGSAINRGGVITLRTSDSSKEGYFANDGGQIVLASYTAHPVVIKTSNTEAMRIDSAGNVGIGTSSPDTLMELRAANPVLTIRDTETSTASNDARLRLAETGVSDALGNYYDIGYIQGNLQFRYNTSEYMRIDSSGNVGLGVTPSAWDSAFKAVEVGGAGYAGSYFSQANGDSSNGIVLNGYYSSGWKYAASSKAATKYEQNNGVHTWSYAASGTSGTGINFSEAMRIDSSGDFLVGTTDNTPVSPGTVSGASIRAGGQIQASSSSDSPLYLNRFTTTGKLVGIRYAGVDVGSIDVTASATTYNTSSDARLKENIADAEDASNLVDAIKVRQFDWKADGSHQRYGMVAQELLEVAPEAVSGDPDSDEMMGVDYSKLVPMLVKEIQSLRARVAQLEGA